MTFESFMVLHDKIGHLIKFYAKQQIYAGRKKIRRGLQVRHGIVPPPPPNGSILSTSRLGCALRYFAGGDPTDIMVNYGIGFTDVLVSVWSVVMAVNRSPDFYICYPDSEIKQKEIAQEFHGGCVISIRGFFPPSSIKPMHIATNTLVLFSFSRKKFSASQNLFSSSMSSKVGRLLRPLGKEGGSPLL